MSKHSCERCGHYFSQKSHYDSHKKGKTLVKIIQIKFKLW